MEEENVYLQEEEEDSNMENANQEDEYLQEEIIDEEDSNMENATQEDEQGRDGRNRLQGATANYNIVQIVDVCTDKNKGLKFKMLLTEMSQSKLQKTIIFMASREKVDRFTSTLRRNGWPANGIHGEIQPNRELVLKEFRTGQTPILVATDVAARGLALDVDDVKFVINYDYPEKSKDYVYRIGRIGRAGKKGTSYTFFTSEDPKQAKDLVDVLKEANQVINPELLYLAGGKIFSSRMNSEMGSSYPPPLPYYVKRRVMSGSQ